MTEMKLAHNVFFTLKDTSDKAVKTLIEECYTLLKDHSGVVYFSAGGMVPENNRDVNVTDFQVGLHIVFTDKSKHDYYQEVSENHKLFIDRNKANWASVRVFDTYVN